MNVGLGHRKTRILAWVSLKLCKILWWPLKVYNHCFVAVIYNQIFKTKERRKEQSIHQKTAKTNSISYTLDLLEDVVGYRPETL